MARRSLGGERGLPSFVVDFLAEAQRRGVKLKTKIE
jgi:hypothetical protein